MVTGITIHDVEILNLIEIMLSSIGCVDAGNTWVETTTEDSRQTCFLEAFAISPLPRVFEMSLILRFIVGSVQIVATCLQTSLHNSEVLIRQGKVHHNVGFIGREQLHQFLHAVGIHLCCLHVRAVLLVEHLSQSITLRLCTTGNHHFVENFRLLSHLVRCHRCYATSADNQYFSHRTL